MNLLKIFAPFAVASFFLTGCGGPSESDCTSAVNKILQKHEVSVSVPGEFDSSATKVNLVFIVPVPAGDPLTKGDETLLNEKYKARFGSQDYKEKFERDMKIARAFEKAGYMKIKEGFFDKLDKASFMDDGTLRKIAGYQISLTEKIKPYYQEPSFIFGPRIVIGNFAIDKITSIESNPQKYGNFEVYSFKYTQKIDNLIEGLPSEVVDDVKSDSRFKREFDENSAQILKKDSEWIVAH